MGQRRTIAGSRMLITGASQGIGKALAEAAIDRGAKVVACARKIDLLEELATALRAKGGVIEIVQADITKPDDRRHLVEATEKAFGGLDILVNNAGIGATGHFADCGPERLREIMEVNFFGVTETTRVFLPMLKKGVLPAIVNISSIAGKRGIPARSEYSASKFAVAGFSEAIRAELAKDGADVIVVSPGLTQTNFSQNMIEQKALVQLDHMRGMSAEDVAYYVLKAIERGDNDTVLTFKGKMLALVARFFPWLADWISKRTVRNLFTDEIEERRRQKEAAASEKQASRAP
ncbi:MAG: SDR family oxidoreductase [Planctomycetes bacterium]|nr:SDR family oxidoreductase [Planctomycetota bacterium]